MKGFDEERETGKRWGIIVFLSLAIITLLVFAFLTGLLEVPAHNVTEPIEPHFSPFAVDIMRGSI